MPRTGETAPEAAEKFAERAKRNHALVRQLRARDAASGRSPGTWAGDSTPSSTPTGAGSIARPFREIRALGYKGSYPVDSLTEDERPRSRPSWTAAPYC